MSFLPHRKDHKGVKTYSHVRAPKQEKESASRFGGHTVKGSGSGQEKGDVRVTGICRIECKTTLKKSFSVTRDMVQKIEDAALMTGEVPAIQIEFLDDRGTPEHSLVVVPTYVLDQICNQSQNK